jgi:tRNA dimethylallyltransferase
MDQIRGVINPEEVIKTLQAETGFLPENLLIILGPTASGKTKFAVECAQILNGEIISADSRQVYRQMDIGTGKDIQAYGNIPYHLIDVVDPGEKYNIHRFLQDFETAYRDIVRRGKKPVVCGGTGFYIQALLSPKPYTQIPIDAELRSRLEASDKENIRRLLDQMTLPTDFEADYSSKKRMIRAIEIARWRQENPEVELVMPFRYSAQIAGLNPDLATRRQRISQRLKQRLKLGMVQEVQGLLDNGLTHDELEYYGLEYKYISQYLQGILSYNEFVKKLETEIHRYAKRQMTYFRKMEKDGIEIKWF